MRLIDADELLEGYKVMGYDPTEHPEESYMEGWCNGFNAAVDHCMHHVIHAQTVMVVNAAPTVEQPEIIRCRDCGHWIPGFINDNDDFVPPRCGKGQQMVGHFADDFCSYGERGEADDGNTD